MAFNFGTTTSAPSPAPAAISNSSNSSSSNSSNSGGGGGFTFSGFGTAASVGGGGFNFGSTAAASTAPASAAASTATTTTTNTNMNTGFSFSNTTIGSEPVSTDASKANNNNAGKLGFSFGAVTTTPATRGGSTSLFGGFAAAGGTAGRSDASEDANNASNKRATTQSSDGPSKESSVVAAASSMATPAAKIGGLNSDRGTNLFGSSTKTSITPGMTPAAKAPSPVKTPNTVGGGVGTPASSSTTTTTTDQHPLEAAPASTKQLIDPPPIEYQSLTIEQIINRFQSELEADAISFLNEAQRIAHYDTVLRSTHQSLSALTNDVSRLMLHQTELDATLQGVNSYQSELSATLDTLERNVDELFAAQVHVPVGDADVERERGYERAIDVENRLDAMDTTLRRVINDLNAAQERVWSSSSLGAHHHTGGASTSSRVDGGTSYVNNSQDEVGKIIGVFNAHQETLAYLESKARSVESDLSSIGQLLARSGK